MKRTWTAALCCFLLAAATAGAQTTGAIKGTVVDSTGAVLPGVTVTISSDAIIGGNRTTVTGDTGGYRFPSVPIGTYAVESTLAGFETQRKENVQVGIAFTATVDFELKLSTISETVTVTGESPVVDVTSSGLASSFKGDMLDDIPTQRSMTDLMQVSPGMSVDYGDSGSGRIVAFGSNRQSNSWNIDGVDVSAPETGAAWWTVNVDNIEEIQIMGVGAPAEFGNHTGSVFNVVTKKGGNTFSGGTDFYYQNESLTGHNVVIDGFGFNRDKYNELTGRLGGPIFKDKVWFYSSGQYRRDASTEPGVDPSLAPTQKSDMFDIKVTGRMSDRNEIGAFFHIESFAGLDAPSPYYTQSALSGEIGKNPAWGVNWTSTLNNTSILEVKYAGWFSSDLHDSQTGSFDEPFIDYTPPDGGPTTYSGGVYYPWNYETWREQFNVKMTKYADNFLGSQHDFRFGVQFSRGSAFTNVGIGPTGTYSYNFDGYIYRAVADPYQYGGESRDLGFFIDDTIQIGHNVTINAGVRADFNTGRVPNYDRLTIGDDSISAAGKFAPTGTKVPGVDVLDWKLISPRLGISWQPRGNGRSVVRASFGTYYDQNVIGNWDAPPPGKPTFRLYLQNPDTGQFDTLVNEVTSEDVGFAPDLKAPRTYQYSAGFEQQIGDSISTSFEYVYKTTADLVGWEIIGGQYEPVPFTDPFTGVQYQLLSQLEVPLLRKGNDPGDFPGSENLDYEQTYHGFVMAIDKRFNENWGVNGSYTWSKSEGLIPRMLSQQQFNPFYGSKEGADPNSFVNAYGRLQGDRPHMFRVQTVNRLPGDIMLSGSFEFSSGRAFNRQIRVGGLGQGTATVIMEPGGSYRFKPIKNIDIIVGKRFALGGNAHLRFDGYIYNILNSDTEITFASLRLQNPGETFVGDAWYKPRRLMLRVGLDF
jgi:Carboxypeptidase regulatory-like domain/TonB dependent receptor-like, beta-barrel/TonB-dependent Receptor Plug Domain